LLLYIGGVSKMQIWRYSGVLLIATGILHNSFGIILGWDFIIGVINDGIWNTIEIPITAATQHTRAELLWFLMLGVSFILIGILFHREIKRTQQPLSASWGWVLLLQGSFIVILFPQTGAWLFIPQGLIILFARVKLPHLTEFLNNKGT